MTTYLTQEELTALQAFARGESKDIDPDVVKKLSILHAEVELNLLKSYSGTRKRNAMLTERVERYRDKDRVRVAEGNFDETGLDSFEVAQGLLYQLQQLKTYRLTKSKVISILYEMYASWLHSKKERLFLENPVATEYGPQFWRVFKRLDTRAAVPYQVWKDLCEKKPGVAKFCQNAAEKYYDYKESDLQTPVLKSFPYRNATKENNGGKWGKPLSDAEIYAWKESLKK